MSDEMGDDEILEVEREDVEIEGVCTYTEDDGRWVVEILLQLSGPFDGRIELSPEDAIRLADTIRAAAESFAEEQPR